MNEGPTLVIGSMGIAVKAHVPDPLQWGTINLGEIRNTIGGNARNIAENLARLDVDVRLLSAVGRDGPARRVIRWTRKVGVNCRYVRVVDDARTANFVSLVDENGEPTVSIHDYAVMEHVDSNYLWKHEPLFENAAMLVIDSTLSDEALATVFEIADRYYVRVCADPTAPALAGRLRPYLPHMYLITPNAAETAILCDLDSPVQERDVAIDSARKLVSMGAMIAVVTLGDMGVAYADGSGSGFIRAVRAQPVDPTGAGDAFMGAVIFGLLNGVEVDEAMRLGMTAASLTLQSRETVLPQLSQELLYDKLVV